MLGKLIKHEFRATARTMLPMLGTVAALSLLAMLAYGVQHRFTSPVVSIFAALVIVMFFVGLFAAGVVALVVMVNRFYRNLLGDEGYLMMTLPTNIHAILWSKLIVSLVWFAATALVMFLALTMAVFCFSDYSVAEFFSGFPSLAQLREALAQYNVLVWNMVVVALELLVLIIVAGLCACLQFYAAMALGHSFTNHRVLLSVVFFVALSTAFEIFGLSLLFVYGGMVFPGSPDTPEELMHMAQLTLLALTGCGGVYGAALYLLSVLGLKKHLNLA